MIARQRWWERLADRGEAVAARGAADQLDAEPCLQLGDVAADHLRGEPERGCSFREGGRGRLPL